MPAISVPIPETVNVGALIGKDGSHLKDLMSRFGTRVWVDNEHMVVNCTGARSDECAEAVRGLIEALAVVRVRAQMPASDVVIVPILPGFNPGALIGEQGSNCKEFQRRFGTRVNVYIERMEVECTGGRTDECAAAVRMQMEVQVDGVVDAYPHPELMMCVLPTGGRWGFGPHAGPRAASPVLLLTVRAPLYVLKLVLAEGLSEVDQLSRTLEAQCLSGTELSACRVGDDGSFRGKWEIPASAPGPGRASFRPPGFSKLDLSLKEEKVLVSVRLEDRAHSSSATAGVVVTLKVDESTGAITDHEINSTANKPAMVAFVNARPEALDFRLILSAQRHILRGSDDVNAQAVWQLAESLRWDAARQELVWPSDADERFVADIVRVKHKTVFEGHSVLQGQSYTMRITVTGVNDYEGYRNEVGGDCVELLQLLQDTKANATAADVKAALGPTVMVLVSFLDVLVDSRLAPACARGSVLVPLRLARITPSSCSIYTVHAGCQPCSEPGHHRHCCSLVWL
ncbi:hypothetical protein FOA52_001425 [Chlamydomonas sp. UWO 241]|nr:hypothetical protein FOA52_001425 [Chlamydomonas sp. UWO 241]